MGILDDVIDGYDEAKKSIKNNLKNTKNKLNKTKDAAHAAKSDTVHYGFSLVSFEQGMNRLGISRETEFTRRDPYFYIKLLERNDRMVRAMSFVGLVKEVPKTSEVHYGDTLTLWGEGAAGRHMRPSKMRKFLHFENLGYDIDYGERLNGASCFVIENISDREGVVKYGDSIIIRSLYYENMYASVVKGYWKLVYASEGEERPCITIRRHPQTPRRNPSCTPFLKKLESKRGGNDEGMEEPDWVTDMTRSFQIASL